MGENIRNVKRKNSNIATWILLIFSVIFFISYPFHSSFLGGLISSLCCAAMIGGVADWFAVVALFRKPLNSNLLAKLFRTEIIPKNRERIFQALVDMVEKELLTKESIVNKLEQVNISETIKQLAKSDQKQELLGIVVGIFQEIIGKLQDQDLENAKEFGNQILKAKLKTVELSGIIYQSLDWMWNNGYKEKITDLAADKVWELSKAYEMRVLIQDAVLQILELNRGNFLIMILGFFIQGNLENIATAIQEKVVSFTAQMKKIESKEREKLQCFIRKQIERIKEEEALKSSIEKWKEEKLEGMEDALGEFRDMLTEYISKLKSEPDKTFHITENVVDKQLQNFMDHEEKQQAVNSFIKSLLKSMVERNHHKIGCIVQERLNGITGEELSNMIEPIIGEDLQLIRINGSLVGGLVGIITYMLTFWIG